MSQRLTREERAVLHAHRLARAKKELANEMSRLKDDFERTEAYCERRLVKISDKYGHRVEIIINPSRRRQYEVKYKKDQRQIQNELADAKTYHDDQVENAQAKYELKVQRAAARLNATKEDAADVQAYHRL